MVKRTKAENEALGRRVIDAVGLPLADDGFSQEMLGETTGWLIDQSQRFAPGNVKPKKINAKKLTKEAQSLALEMERLRSRVLKLNASWDYQLMREVCEAASRKFPLEEMADTLAEMSEKMSGAIRVSIEDSAVSLASSMDTMPSLVGRWFFFVFRFYFGDHVPTVTYDDEAGTVLGPFVRFSRLILDEAGVSLSDAAIAKYPSRVKQRNEISWFLKD